jgi:hypothetical protein
MEFSRDVFFRVTIELYCRKKKIIILQFSKSLAPVFEPGGCAPRRGFLSFFVKKKQRKGHQAT